MAPLGAQRCLILRLTAATFARYGAIARNRCESQPFKKTDHWQSTYDSGTADRLIQAALPQPIKILASVIAFDLRQVLILERIAWTIDRPTHRFLNLLA